LASSTAAKPRSVRDLPARSYEKGLRGHKHAKYVPKTIGCRQHLDEQFDLAQINGLLQKSDLLVAFGFVDIDILGLAGGILASLSMPPPLLNRTKSNLKVGDQTDTGCKKLLPLIRWRTIHSVYVKVTKLSRASAPTVQTITRRRERPQECSPTVRAILLASCN
jgi:hypothetical protein